MSINLILCLLACSAFADDIFDATGSFLYDLSIDSIEETNVWDDSQYSDNKEYLLERMEYWQDIQMDLTFPDTTDMKKAWTQCGGVCPWLTTDYEPVTIDRSSNTDGMPNIVFVMVDDWGYNDAGWQSSYLSWTTPNIDRFASTGITFSNYFTHSTSIPSRASFLTGRYPLRMGLWGTEKSQSEPEVPLTESTIGQEMQKAGYRTYMIGKWAAGFSTPMHNPVNRGFDYFYGYFSDSIDYWTKESDEYLDLQEGEELVDTAEDLSSDNHNAYNLESKAEAVISSHHANYPSTPMFLYYSLQLISGEWSAPDVFLSRCKKPSSSSISDDTLKTEEFNYCALNVMLDEVMGNLTCTLEAHGMGNNTYMILVSDNGGDSAVDGNNYPYFGHKGDHYRGGLTSNAFIHSSLIPREMHGLKYEGLMHVTDWLPTLMAMATNDRWSSTVSGEELDGVNMWSSISNNVTSVRHEIVHDLTEDETSLQYDMIKMDIGTSAHQHKPAYEFEEDEDPTLSYLQCTEPSLVSIQTTGTDDVEIVLGNGLYNLMTDPTEMTNLYASSDYADILSDMLESVSEWQTKVVAGESPSGTNKHSTWNSCGGVCPWLDGNDDDQATYEPLTVTQKYAYEDAPNIIFVLVDDWGFNDVGYRSTYLSWTTPTIDRLASEGVKLENYYSHYSCVPSRGALLTGRYAIRLGLWESREGAELPLDEVTMGQEMQSAGYRTYLVGKWHLGLSTTQHTPTSRGFDSFYGYLSGQVDYWTKQYGNFLDLHSSSTAVDGNDIVTDETETSSSLHNAHLLQSKAEEAIADHAANHADVPMFLYYSLQLIHGEWAAPESYLQRCAYPDSNSIADSDIADIGYNYCALNVMLDEAVTNLTCALEAHGMADNTVMVLVSDNGGEVSVDGNNYPYRGAKGSYARGGVSVTGLIHSPFVADSMQGQSYYGQMHVTDWLPTLMGLATGGEWTGGLTGAELDGVDMWTAIMTNASSPHTEMVHYCDGELTCSYQRDMYKLDIEYDSPAGTAAAFVYEQDEDPTASVTTCTDPTLMSSASSPKSSGLARGSRKYPSSTTAGNGGTGTGSDSSANNRLGGGSGGMGLDSSTGSQVVVPLVLLLAVALLFMRSRRDTCSSPVSGGGKGAAEGVLLKKQLEDDEIRRQCARDNKNISNYNHHAIINESTALLSTNNP